MAELPISLDEDLEELVQGKQLQPMEAVQIQTLRDIQQLTARVADADESKKNVPIKIRARKKSGE